MQKERKKIHIDKFYRSWFTERLVCYWRRILDGNRIPTNICTHIIYTFVAIADTSEIQSPEDEGISQKSFRNFWPNFKNFLSQMI